MLVLFIAFVICLAIVLAVGRIIIKTLSMKVKK